MGMDLSKVLVMVLSIVASELSHVCTKPLDFVCDSEARGVMNKVKDLEVEMVHERRAEILLSLGTLAQDVRTAKTLIQPGCGLTLLVRLERSINNYLHVVKLLHGEVRMITSDAGKTHTAGPCVMEERADTVKC
ncbi:hypothetical protein E1301_Tti007632 [Triplophysa tibetana]|uniref:Uncharacterized protein n=1 Tax=Triplophysa tibetana TaxID=1572043 RepID=A0A5A9PAN8_9TELE|nr:hypothetical protein E1301_Tti007632 [Triplophysa tibetana]